MPRKSLTTQQFVEKATNVHKNKYDYSKVKYINTKTKIIIICPAHGEFPQMPYRHLQGFGCLACSGKKPHTIESFIKASRKTHGDKYDYSKVNYINNKTKIIIICPAHGEFPQMPQSHLQGFGCLTCAGKKPHTIESFIKASRKTHGDKYDYSKVKLINETAIIICPKHGEFAIKPAYHMQRGGCPKCVKQRPYTTESFIEKVKKIHGNKYDYRKVNYINVFTNVIIVCPIHGEFKQQANSHIRGSGCPFCNESKLEKTTASYLKKLNIKFEREKKFDSCKNKQCLPFDFKIEHNNKIALAECQGIQHFQIIDYFGGQKGFKKRQKHDWIKREWCKKNNIPLLEITYWELDEEIVEKTIDNFLKTL